MILQSTQIVI